MRGILLKHLSPKKLLVLSLIGVATLVGLLIYTVYSDSNHKSLSQAKVSKLEKINATENEGPDLSVTINDTFDQVTTDQNLNYTIEASNLGNLASNNVKVVTTFSKTPVYDLTNSSAGWVCQENSCILNIELLDISFTQNLNLSIKTPSSFNSSEVEFIASVNISDDGLNGADLDPTDNIIDEKDNIIAAPQMKVTVSTIQSSYVEGQKVIYKIDAVNIGNRDASNPKIIENIPSFTIFSQTESTNGWSCLEGDFQKDCELTLGYVEAKSNVEVYFTVSINSSPQPMTSITQIVNNLTITNGEGIIDGNLPPVNPESLITPVYSPDLAVTKEFLPGSSAPNQNVIVRITIQNTGTSNAFETTIRDNSLPMSKFNDVHLVSMPEGFFFEYSQIENNNVELFTANPGVYIAPGESKVFEFIVRLTNDFNDGDNFVSYSTATVAGLEGDVLGKRVIGPVNTSATLSIGRPDLSVNITNNLTVIKPGKVTNYVITVTNNGHSASQNIKFTETIPEFSTYIPNGINNWNCIGSNCTLIIDRLEPGENFTVYFNLRVDVSIPQTITFFSNTVTVQDDGNFGNEIDLSNNSSTDTDKVAKIFFP